MERITGKQPNTYSDISEVHPTSVLPLRQNLVTELPWVMQIQTGVTWTLDALLPDYVFKVYGGTVAWKSRRQPTVALSTTEAEYMASADAARQAILDFCLMTFSLVLATNLSPS